MNSRLLKQASIPFLAVLAIWWWSGDDVPAPEPREQAAQQSTTTMPGQRGLQGYYGMDRQTAWRDTQAQPYAASRVQGPTQQYWAPEQTHIGPYRFRPLSEREKRRLYSAPAYSDPGHHSFQPDSYARAIPRFNDQRQRRPMPRWNERHAGGYNYRPTDPDRASAQGRGWRPDSTPSTRWSSPYSQGPEPWSSPDYRWTAESPSWQSPAERMLPAVEIGLDPTLSSLY